MFTAEEMDTLRALDRSAMPDSMTISRPGTTADGIGGTTDTTSTVSSGVECRVTSADRSQNTRTIAERLGISGGVVVDAPLGTNVQARDVLTVTPWNGSAVRTLRVVQVVHETFETSLTLICQEGQ